MGRSRKVVDGGIEVTETPDVKIYRETRRELVSQIDRIQTKIDHLQLNIQEQRNLKQDLVADLEAIDA